MRKDINKMNKKTEQYVFKPSDDEILIAVGETAKGMGNMLWKAFITIFTVLAIAGSLVLVSVLAFIFSLRDTEVASLTDYNLSLSSKAYVQNDAGEWEEYVTFHRTEDRTWVKFTDIPQDMKDAMIAIEDHRFYDHDGVDWITTLKATLSLATGNGGAGGSTITQQLIKNITMQNDVSVLRKVREIFSALNLEEKYTKDEILEYYLNLVNYGSGCNGVQAAANEYFGKDIWDCSIAECAAIAGITKNPYALNPKYFPENNKERQQTVLGAMYEYGYITKREYDKAMEESENMNWAFKETTTGSTEAEKDEMLSPGGVWNWYIETMVDDIIADLQETYNISSELAWDKLYNDGLRIYCAMDEDIQNGVQRIFLNANDYVDTDDSNIQYSCFAMDYDGRVIAVVGSRFQKTGNRWLNYATETTRQPGSSFKPVSVYASALETNTITYSTMLEDQPIEDYFGPGEPGPYNFSRYYEDWMTVADAIEVSQNAPAAQLCKLLSPGVVYDLLTNYLHFTTLDPVDDQTLSMSIGGLKYGVTVREMTAAYQVFGNNGEYHKPYTYYYITDNNNNTVLDNRNLTPEKAISDETATIMNRLLRRVVNEGTGYMAQVDGVQIFGKTGTTDGTTDTWFVGGSPFAVVGVWSGYAESQTELPSSNTSRMLFPAVMSYLRDNYFEEGMRTEFEYSENVIAVDYCEDSGKRADESCENTRTGYYRRDDVPPLCNGFTDHIQYGAEESELPSPSVSPSATPIPPTIKPSVTPAPEAQSDESRGGGWSFPDWFFGGGN